MVKKSSKKKIFFVREEILFDPKKKYFWQEDFLFREGRNILWTIFEVESAWVEAIILGLRGFFFSVKAFNGFCPKTIFHLMRDNVLFKLKVYRPITWDNDPSRKTSQTTAWSYCLMNSAQKHGIL